MMVNMIVKNFLILIFTYLISSGIIALVLTRFSKKTEPVIIFITSLGVGPMIISLILYFLFLFFPYQSAVFYVSIVLLFFLLVLLINVKYIPEFMRLCKESCLAVSKSIRFRDNPLSFNLLILIIAAYIILILLQAVALPIVTHDTCHHLITSKSIYEYRNLDFYPMTEPDSNTGYYVQITHPPGFYMISVWFFLLQESAQSDVLVRTLAIYGLYIVLLLIYILRDNKFGCIFGAFSIITIPLFIIQNIAAPIDMIRVFLFFLALFWLSKLLEKENLFNKVISGFIVGLNLFIHLLGAFVAPIILFVYFALSKQTIKKKLVTVVLLVFIVSIVGGAHLLILHEKGFIGGDSKQGDPLIGKYYGEHNLKSRGQDSPVKELFFGKLQPFTRFSTFGISFYLFILSFTGLCFFKSITKLDKVMIIAAGIHWFLVLYLGLWSNWRYMMPILPIAAYFSGRFAGVIHDKLSENRVYPHRNYLIKLTALFIIIVMLMSSGIPLTTSKICLLSKTSVVSPNIKYLFSGTEEEKVLACGGDVFYTIDYINKNTPENSTCFVFRTARYFYYAERKGIGWYNPRMYDFYRIGNKTEAYHYLVNLGIDYILIDGFYELNPAYYDSELIEIINDQSLAILEYQKGSARVYKLYNANGRG